MSAIQKEPSIIRVLAENCSITDLDALDQNGKTPLMHAVENGLVENISAILSREVFFLQLLCHFYLTFRLIYTLHPQFIEYTCCRDITCFIT